ncbi:hypothetical protein KAH43_04770, partial [Candidatus Bipolaricaulota bacterium]|nr:hypothetical protein [Candidatus Bipolaricaulota bacterium]
MRTLFVLAVLSTCLFPFSLVATAESPPATLATEPVYALDILYNADTRTIEGSFDLEFTPEADTVYFSLLANLDSDPNPYVSSRQQDAVYPYGFEPSRITVLAVELLTGNQAEAIAFRTLAMPPSWQTYSLEDTVLAVELPTITLETPITIRCHFITDVPRTTLGDQAVTAGILTWRFGWFPMLFPEQSLIVERDGLIGYEGKTSLPLVFPWVRLSAEITIPAGSKLIVGTDRFEELAPKPADATEPNSQTEQTEDAAIDEANVSFFV